MTRRPRSASSTPVRDTPELTAPGSGVLMSREKAGAEKDVSEKPRKRDSIGTQEKILAAAMAEFARKGYDGARVDAIIARAKISKNLLYHHFRSKEELYVKVLERTYETMRRRHEEVPLAGLDPLEAMRRLCESTFQTFIEEPEVIVMMNTENLHRGKHVAKSPIIRQLYSRLSHTIQTILEQGEARGLFRKGIDPVELYISISALGYFYLSNRYTLSMIFERDLKSPENLARRKAHIVDMTMAYLTAGLPGAPLAPDGDAPSLPAPAPATS